jgi:hypothetical protein
MPPLEDIQRQLHAAWRMMITGKPETVRAFDLSIDGFWNSFFAIVIAVPALIVGWVPLANVVAGADSTAGMRLVMMLRVALVDLGAWIVPIILLALASGFLGIRDRFIPLVVATNWASALYAFMMLPTALLRLVFPAMEELSLNLSLMVFLASLVLSWRLTNAALNKGPMLASGVFAGLLIASIATVFLLQELLMVAQPQ